MKASVVETEEEFSSLREAWGRLHRDARHASVFSTWEWQFLWWKTYGRNRPLRILLVRDGDRLVGILPLYLQPQRVVRGVTATLLRLVGTGGDTYPDDLGPILAEQESAAAVLAESLLASARGWDVLFLTDLLPQSAFLEKLETACARHRLSRARGISARIPYLDLPASWNDYLESLHRDRRWRIRNSRKKLEAQFKTRFFVWQDAATLDAAVDRLVELHQGRWQAAGQSHSFASDAYIGFHRSVMRACLENGWLRLYCLEADGRLIAMYYFYRFRNQVFLMQGGFDPEFSKHKPGQVLMGHALEHAIGEGNTVFDFLRGEHRYKNELASGSRETVSFTVYRRTAAALAYRARREHLPAMKGAVKRALTRVGLIKPPESH